MSLHVPYHHECPKCGAYYIPFDLAAPCPRCGEIETERFDYVTKAAASARVNLRESGEYVPAAWYVGSLGDHVLNILFPILQAHREDAAGRTFSEVATEALDRLKWGEQSYLRDHVYAIACRVREQLDQDEATPSGGNG